MQTIQYDIKQIIKEYNERLFILAVRMVGDEMIAEEILQDAYMIIQSKISDFRGDSTVYTWIYKIVSNLCLKAKSTLSRERILRSQAEMDEMMLNGTLLKNGKISQWKNSPEDNMLYQALIAKVRTKCHLILLGLLTKEQRITFILRSHFELSFADIGEVLGIKENAAKSRMNRAVKIIAQDLHSRCSIHNLQGCCDCENCATYIAYKYPEILHEVDIDKQFIEEAKAAFKSSHLEHLYRMLPN